MSVADRQFVCDRFGTLSNLQRNDLMDESVTTTYLIAALFELLHCRNGVWQGKLEMLSVRSDHPTYDGPNGHAGGNACDFAPIVDDADAHLIADIVSCPNIKGIGLGGFYKNFAPKGLYSEADKCFPDNDSPHIHIQVVSY